ncbi:MAG: hypothetical protein BAJALOKI1v1_440018 [Promethearchaeota archaeon]|nr:MAG: hypothetical protein BAJALOKI1v1_440018 [Candidatus Lokiarchaeota archaeon]
MEHFLDNLDKLESITDFLQYGIENKMFTHDFFQGITDIKKYIIQTEGLIANTSTLTPQYYLRLLDDLIV